MKTKKAIKKLNKKIARLTKAVKKAIVFIPFDENGLQNDGSWPFCGECNSYHHPDNPNCKKTLKIEVALATEAATEIE